MVKDSVNDGTIESTNKLVRAKFEILSTKINKLASVHAGKPASILDFDIRVSHLYFLLEA